ncbi:PAS domain-containing protein [Algibacter sp. L4_22]|uniref:sensor histidine kinase n=1 Tax=Algibacter sp. L4_22 TaxID=2942477 RepID=UPI00201B8547|nr:PAS domain-containing sensor histidine kinase [Algibacter sp. L4_22]MCL5129120.1 PAS domain-containing sensor histidine kinase [Algibacter sp. L4_22]
MVKSIFSPIRNLFKRTSNSTESDSLKWQFAVENSKIGVWDWDAKTNKVFYSAESKNILGYEDNEIGSNADEWNNRVHPEDRDAYHYDFQKHLSGEIEIYKNEHRVLCKDGTYRWILDQGKIVSKDKIGKPLRIIGTHIDITKRKEDEMLLNENFNVITSQNKRLYNFTHIVSHNLRTHIGNFKNVLEFHDSAKTQEEKDEMFNYLKTISSALTTTISNLSDVISVNSEYNDLTNNVNISNVIIDSLDNLSIDIASKEAIINTDIPSNLFLTGNSAYLESIFHNLISNAIKYVDASVTPKVNIKSTEKNEGFEISITDNGIGIDLNKYKDQVFGMYNTFHESNREDSEGIGLYLTKIQVEDLGGQITIESELNIGTTFKLFFPKEKAFLLNKKKESFKKL